MKINAENNISQQSSTIPRRAQKVSKVNLKRNNHYLPVCYQLGFADSFGKIWVKFAERSNAEHRKPLKVGRLRSFYIMRQNGTETDDIERFLETIETPFAPLSRRIQAEGNKFSKVSPSELGALGLFVASQAVRTLAHRRCVEEQAGGPVDTDTFVRVLIKMTRRIVEAWTNDPPQFDFYTPLPYIGEQFITGDNPVIAILINNNPVWVPSDTPALGVRSLKDILESPQHGFSISLSPYVMVTIHPGNTGQHTLPPRTLNLRDVRFFNERVRGQSKLFTLAKDKGSLEAR